MIGGTEMNLYYTGRVGNRGFWWGNTSNKLYKWEMCNCVQETRLVQGVQNMKKRMENMLKGLADTLYLLW